MTFAGLSKSPIDRNALFSPCMVGAISVANRIVMAPMTRARAGGDGVHTSIAVDYYRQRASAGLIITESTNISNQGRAEAFTPGIYTNRHVAAWREVTHAVHEAGGRIVMQLRHAGRFSHNSLQEQGRAPVAPSAIRAQGELYIERGFATPSIPRALEEREIPKVIADFLSAALNARSAGFDGVEIHAANSYLLEQFLRDSTNHRMDKYGGSIENRARLTIEVTKAVSAAFGCGRVGVRLSPITTAVGYTPLDSTPHETYGYLAEQLGKLKLAYLHCIEGQTRGTNAAKGFDFQMLRKLFGGRYIANNGYTYCMASGAIANGSADLVAFGRAYIANPDLVERFRRELPLSEATREEFYGRGAGGYTDWQCL